MSKRITLTCKKSFAGDPKQYGIDCIQGNKYSVNMVDDDCYYINTESGSDVIMNIQEVREHFYI
jgi:hypothetical protein